LAVAVLLTGGLVAGSAFARTGLACQRLVIASSSEKAGMLKEFASAYDRAGRSAGGGCVRVVIDEINSGNAERALETGWRGQPSDRPDVWSPAGRAWVVLLEQRSGGGGALIRPGFESLFQSPLVIGMPEPMAAALGYPGKQLGWSDVLGLVNSPGGWATVGHPEWGLFKLGKTNPTVSTSGLHALIGTYFAAAGGDLTRDAVASARVRSFVGGVEKGVVHYGETAADFLHNLRDADDRGSALDYISAIAIEEKELTDYNAGLIAGVRQAVPRVPLVPIYPKEGTPVADHPYVVLKSSAHQAAARDFYDFMKEPAQQAAMDASGFRDRFGRTGESARARPFLNSSQPALVLEPPPGPTLEAMIGSWQVLRKRARVLILVDTAAASGPLSDAISRLAPALSGLEAGDQAGVWVFPSSGSANVSFTEVRPVSAVGDPLRRALDTVHPAHGPSDLVAPLRAAVSAMSASYDSTAVNAVLLLELSPGSSGAGDEQLARELRNQDQARFVRVFTVGPPSQRLAGIALAGRGASYQPGSTTHFLDQVISSF
jgi:Ca-activated chloride channel homolog